MKKSEINGLFNEVEELKRHRLILKEKIDFKVDQIIDHILQNGNVMAYKNDIPHILTVGSKITTKFNKTQLANDTGKTEKELNLVGIAELVEEKRTTSDALQDYYYDDNRRVLKARKAKKSDLELLRSRGHI